MSEDMRFNGSDYDAERDGPRLSKQYDRVFGYMCNGEWATLGEISAATGDPEASVSAQLRHARKERFGGHEVQKKHEGNGLYLYRLLVNKEVRGAILARWALPKLEQVNE
jgi:hypothetical protein